MYDLERLLELVEEHGHDEVSPQCEICKEITKLMKKCKSALKLLAKIRTKDISLYEEALETVEKIQFGKELDKWDSANLQYTIEDLLKYIIDQAKKEGYNAKKDH